MVQAGGIAGEQLRSFIERIERLEEEKKGIAEDIKEVYAGAKAVGFDTKVMRKVVAIRKMDAADRQEQDALTDVYLHAVEGGQQPAASVQEEPAPEAAEQAPATTAASGDSDRYAQAVEIVRRDMRASTSYVQRRLKVGYNEAAGYIERMEAEGVISAPNDRGVREILKPAA